MSRTFSTTRRQLTERLAYAENSRLKLVAALEYAVELLKNEYPEEQFQERGIAKLDAVLTAAKKSE